MILYVGQCHVEDASDDLTASWMSQRQPAAEAAGGCHDDTDTADVRSENHVCTANYDTTRSHAEAIPQLSSPWQLTPSSRSFRSTRNTCTVRCTRSYTTSWQPVRGVLASVLAAKP